MSQRPAEMPSGGSGKLQVRTAPGSLTLSRTTVRISKARILLVTSLTICAFLAFVAFTSQTGAIGPGALIFAAVSLTASIGHYFVVYFRPETMELTLTHEAITRRQRFAPTTAFRAPALFTITPLMGSRALYRGEEPGPAGWQWLLVVSSLLDGPIDQMLVGAEELRAVTDAVAQAGPAVAQFGNPENTLLPWVTVCPQCGYDLIGIGQPRCPECGLPISPDNFRHLQALAQERRSPAH